jgi:hypothetical protein
VTDVDLFTATEAKPSDRAITQDLMARLQRHYIKPGAPFPGGIFLPEVGWNGGVGSTRADAIYVGFTSASGRLLVGHEVKASRSDWLNELNKPGKADAWADQCHEWWLVAAPGIVHDGELPDGWGLMVPGRSKTRLEVKVRAWLHRDRTPSWDAVRSIMGRQDTLRVQAISDAKHQAQLDARTEFQANVDREVSRQMGLGSKGGVEDLRAELERIRRALGVASVVGEDDMAWGPRVTEATLADLAQLLRHHRTLDDAASALLGRYSPPGVDSLRRAITEVERAHRKVIAEIQGQAEVGT